VKQDFLTC